MRWPWQPRETRQQSSYTDTLIQTLVNQASGQPVATPLATAALEAAAGAVGRAFASAMPEGSPDIVSALTPACLGMIGRELIRNGECVSAISIVDGRVHLQPAADWDVSGSNPDPMTWNYRVNLPAPDRYRTLAGMSGESVAHFMYQTEPATPWKGIGPLQAAAQSGRLSGELTKALADEASGPRGSVMPTPKDGQDPTLQPLIAQIKRLFGGMAFVQTMASEWTAGSAAASPADWEQKRLGASPPQPLVLLHQVVSQDVWAACGTSGLFDQGNDSAGREAFRRFLHGTVSPLAKRVEAELTAKLEPVKLNFDALFASDLSGRARAFGSLVKGGMDVSQAAQLSGLIDD